MIDIPNTCIPMNITLVRVTLSLDPLSKILYSSLVDGEINMVGVGDPTKGCIPIYQIMYILEHQYLIFSFTVEITYFIFSPLYKIQILNSFSEKHALIN